MPLTVYPNCSQEANECHMKCEIKWKLAKVSLFEPCRSFVFGFQVIAADLPIVKVTVSWADFIAALSQTWKDYKFVNLWGSFIPKPSNSPSQFWVSAISRSNDDLVRRHWSSLRRLNFRPVGVVSYIRYHNSSLRPPTLPLPRLPFLCLRRPQRASMPIGWLTNPFRFTAAEYHNLLSEEEGCHAFWALKFAN